MKSKNDIFRMDLFRTFVSPWFYLSILLVVALCFLCNWSDLEQVLFHGRSNSTDVTYVFTILMGLGEFKNMLLIAAALPCVGNFCSDWNYQFIRPVIIRCGVRKYSYSKIASCLISTFLTVFIGLTIFVLLLNLRLPLYQVGRQITLGKPYDALIHSNFPLLYFVVKIFILSVASAF